MMVPKTPNSASPRPDLESAALELHRAGFSVLPVRSDGTKAPAVLWKGFQAKRPSPEQLSAWFGSKHNCGIGVITGEVSGSLEMLEFEGRATGLLKNFEALMQEHQLGDLWGRLTSGWVERSPSGGVHWFYRVDGPPRKNTRLAERSSSASNGVEVLVETRGEGGYVIVAPSNGGTHASGTPWTRLAGGPEQVPCVTVAERDALYDIAALLDQKPGGRALATGRFGEAAEAGNRPGDEFSRRSSWDQILEPHGWQRTPQYSGPGTGWTRPGKDPAAGLSATTSANGSDSLYVFSTSTPFEAERAYGKFAAYSVLNCGGDFIAAARTLRASGYGAGRRSASSAPLDAGDGSAAGEGNDGPASVFNRRPRVNVTNSAVMADWLRSSMGTGELSGMFLRGRDIVYTPCSGQEGYVALTTPGSDGPAQVRVVNKSTLASRIQYKFDCYRVVDGDEYPAMFPADAARVATDVPEELPNLRPLNGVVHTPVLRADGTVLTRPGYDGTTGLLYLPQSLCVPAVPDRPTKQEVAAAKSLLDKMTAGFDFVTDDDRANYYGLLMTPLLRGMAPPPYKLAAISSPQPGSGKTLLASIARTIHGGVFRAEVPEDDRELRKQITALLTVTTGPLIHFDNVSGTLRSSTMAGLLTSRTWGDRPLGLTDWVETPNDRLWMITGNNLHIGGDLIRRTLKVNIDPGVPNPERRTGFAIRDLERWVDHHRAELLHALLTLARAWVAGGSQSLVAQTSDGYSQWTDTLASILSFAGVPGTFGAPVVGVDALGADDEDWEEFLAAAHGAFGTEPWTVRELVDRIVWPPGSPPDTGVQADAGLVPISFTSLPASLQDKARRTNDLASINRPLGSWISKMKGRWGGAYTARFVREGRARERFWCVALTPS